MPIRTVLIDDDHVLCEQVARFLRGADSVDIVGVFHDAESALEALRGESLRVDVALVDMGLPGLSGLELVRRLAASRPAVQCVMFTSSSHDDVVFPAFEAGACGYLLKSTEGARLVDRIVEVARGGVPISPGVARRVLAHFRDQRARVPVDPPAAPALTPREAEVLELLARGHTYSTIAHTLAIGVGTVQSYVKTIYRKLEISSKAEAAAEAVRRGLL